MSSKKAFKRKAYNRDVREEGTLVRNFVKEWRLHRGIDSQSKLAELANLPAQTICRLEAHKMAWTWMSMQKLAKALNCSEGDLISTHPREKEMRDRYIANYDRLSLENKIKIEGQIQMLVEPSPIKGSSRRKKRGAVA
jgi:hypothetical protein